MPYDLTGKVAIVTGSAQGGGKGIANVLGRNGAKVMLADIQEQRAKDVVRELQDEGINASFCKTDLTCENDVKTLINETVRHFGQLNILASNAGIYPVNPIESMTTEQWFKVINVNLTAAFWLTRECIPHMKQAGGGRIIYTSSTTGPTTVIPGMSHYAATKAGLEGWMRSAAVELAKHKITVNCVAPGALLSPTLEALLSDDDMKAVEKSIPLGRIGMPEDIGHAYAFLASDEASYITGITIRSDGGFVLPELVVEV